jgi:hypothetical protein
MIVLPASRLTSGKQARHEVCLVEERLNAKAVGLLCTYTDTNGSVRYAHEQAISRIQLLV